MLTFVLCMVISAITAYLTTLIVESIKVKKTISAVAPPSDAKK